MQKLSNPSLAGVVSEIGVKCKGVCLKTIKSKDDLPDWFFKRQYKNNLTLLDWYYEIQWRIYHIELAESPDWLEHAKNGWSQTPDRSSIVFYDFKQPPPTPVADFTQFNLAFAYFHEFENPHSTFYKQDNLKQHLEYLLSKYNHKDGKQHQTLGYPLYFDITKQQLENDRKLMGILPPTGWWFYNDMFCGAYRGMDGFPITVNLHYDDSYLIKEFKSWLAEKRKKHKDSKPRLSEKNPISANDSRVSDWSLGKYRQLIDLDYWAKWEKVIISEKLLIETIWPTSVKNEETPNKTTKTIEHLKDTRRQYRAVFNKRTLNRLINQLRQSQS